MEIISTIATGIGEFSTDIIAATPDTDKVIIMSPEGNFFALVMETDLPHSDAENDLWVVCSVPEYQRETLTAAAAEGRGYKHYLICETLDGDTSGLAGEYQVMYYVADTTAAETEEVV